MIKMNNFIHTTLLKVNETLIIKDMEIEALKRKVKEQEKVTKELSNQIIKGK